MATALIDNLKALYTDFSPACLDALPSLYREDVVFVDPVHRIDGLQPLRRYFAGMINGLIECRFEFDAQTIGCDSACVSWHMHFRHARLQRGAPLVLRGITRVCFDDRIYYHEDFYDLGAMVYEHIPLMGGVTRFIKSRLSA